MLLYSIEAHLQRFGYKYLRNMFLWSNQKIFIFILLFFEDMQVIAFSPYYMGNVEESNYKANEQGHDKIYKRACAHSEDADQPGHLPSLIRDFTIRSVGS